VGIDEKGHISLLENENITLPKPSLTTNGSGVLTSASLVEETGTLTANYTALSDVKLDGYEKTAATGDIFATDSLETGLSKLENAIAFTNDAIEEVDAQLREDFAAEDTAIRSELAAVNTAVRTDFAAADTTLQNNINNVNTSLGNRITVIENKEDFGIGALTTKVESNELNIGTMQTSIASMSTDILNGKIYKAYSTESIRPTDLIFADAQSASGTIDIATPQNEPGLYYIEAHLSILDAFTGKASFEMNCAIEPTTSYIQQSSGAAHILTSSSICSLPGSIAGEDNGQLKIKYSFERVETSPLTLSYRYKIIKLGNINTKVSFVNGEDIIIPEEVV
jgi:hypothetical protein